MKAHLIHIKDFCASHEIDIAFIMGLEEYELIELRVVDNNRFITVEELPKVEKMVRMHQDLSINTEGIEAIQYLLERTERMYEEIRLLKQRLKRHEEI